MGFRAKKITDLLIYKHNLDARYTLYIYTHPHHKTLIFHIPTRNSAYLPAKRLRMQYTPVDALT